MTVFFFISSIYTNIYTVTSVAWICIIAEYQELSMDSAKQKREYGKQCLCSFLLGSAIRIMHFLLIKWHVENYNTADLKTAVLRCAGNTEAHLKSYDHWGIRRWQQGNYKGNTSEELRS